MLMIRRRSRDNRASEAATRSSKPIHSNLNEQPSRVLARGGCQKGDIRAAPQLYDPNNILDRSEFSDRLDSRTDFPTSFPTRGLRMVKAPQMAVFVPQLWRSRKPVWADAS
jgi:hypothetical protein